ncbi:uncharacterized protein METZ01_LOCUS211976, partial [marine metagenome]
MTSPCIIPVPSPRIINLTVYSAVIPGPIVSPYPASAA